MLISHHNGKHKTIIQCVDEPIPSHASHRSAKQWGPFSANWGIPPASHPRSAGVSLPCVMIVAKMVCYHSRIKMPMPIEGIYLLLCYYCRREIRLTAHGAVTEDLNDTVMQDAVSSYSTALQFFSRLCAQGNLSDEAKSYLEQIITSYRSA